MVCCDAAAFYPPVAGDDTGALAAVTVDPLASPARDGFGAATISPSAMPPFSMDFFEKDLGGGGSYDKLWALRVANQVRSTAATFRDYDPERPNVRLQSAAAGTEPFAPSAADLMIASLAARLNATSAVAVAAAIGPKGDRSATSASATPSQAQFPIQGTMEVYEHHSPFLFPTWQVARDEATLLLRQQRRRASLARGEGGCHDFSAGHTFELHGHPAKLDGGWTLIAVEHEGQTADAHDVRQYSNRFECVPSTVLYPPKRPARTSIQAALTATVVGAPGEEIFTDERGRIKVQFHWDREGRFDAASSCWVRVVHPWAGAGWGHQFIPRVGMEVLVVFDGGDPDKPIVTGTVFNATHPCPFPFPQEKTRSGIRTQSSPGGDGFNELSFQDRSGQEEIYVHAHRDLREDIGSDRFTRIGVNDSERVGNNRSLYVGSTLLEEVDGDRHEVTKGARYDFVKGRRVESVKGDSTLKVQGNVSVEVGAPERPRSNEQYTHGSHIVGAAERIELRAEGGIRLSCGDSRIDIGPDEIFVTSKHVRVQGGADVLLHGDGPFLRLDTGVQLAGDTVRVMSSKASLELDDDANLDGKKVKFNCRGAQGSATGKRVAVKTKTVKLRLTDEYFEALGGKDYVAVSGGARYEGTTDSDGRLELDVPEEATSLGITVFMEKRPTGAQLRYRIRLEDLPPPNTVRGAKARLENLGYYWGDCNDTFDDFARSALREFQRDHALEMTGTLDGATLAKLVEIAQQ